MNSHLMEELRKRAAAGASVCALVQLIRNEVSPDDFGSFIVMNYFMQAFNLTLTQVRELPGAICLGGEVYSDIEINNLILPHIARSS